MIPSWKVKRRKEEIAVEDENILDLYFARDPEAIRETDTKYGAYCGRISLQILGSREDAEECVNDTWLRAWNAIPPERPRYFKAFLGRITRNLSLDRWECRRAGKRGGGRVEVLLSELEDCVADAAPPERQAAEREIGAAVSMWLAEQPRKNRVAFVRRYWYADSLAETAARVGCSQSAAKSLLHRMRQGLRSYLQEEGMLE